MINPNTTHQRNQKLCFQQPNNVPAWSLFSVYEITAYVVHLIEIVLTNLHSSSRYSSRELQDLNKSVFKFCFLLEPECLSLLVLSEKCAVESVKKKCFVIGCTSNDQETRNSEENISSHKLLTHQFKQSVCENTSAQYRKFCKAQWMSVEE